MEREESRKAKRLPEEVGIEKSRLLEELQQVTPREEKGMEQEMAGKEEDGAGGVNALLLARQRLAATDLAKFAPPPKRKKAEPEPTKYTTPAVKTSAEERNAARKEYAHAYYLAHKAEKKKRDAEYRQKNPEVYRSNSLQWYYDHKEHCSQKNREWRESHKEQKLESHRKWMAKHPGYYTKEAKLKRKEKRDNERTAEK